ncbi:MAG: DUF3470 domain-containing protein [Burkholderiales bacterium]|nr:DUF3470 domain-containing protein [Burkholderiales bacterium]
MTHVVTEACIRCKYTDCVDVCPVAILPEEDVPGDQIHMIKINADLAKSWPSITKRKPALPDADEWKDKTGKLPELIR